MEKKLESRLGVLTLPLSEMGKDVNVSSPDECLQLIIPSSELVEKGGLAHWPGPGISAQRPVMA